MNKVIEYLEALGLTPDEEAKCFGREYMEAIIGISTDGRIVYSYWKMVKWLMENRGWEEEESIYWIDVNVLGSISSMGDRHPIIVFEAEYED